MGKKTTTTARCDLCGMEVIVDGDGLPDKWVSAFYADDLNFLNRGQEKQSFNVACPECFAVLRKQIDSAAQNLAHSYKEKFYYGK